MVANAPPSKELRPSAVFATEGPCCLAHPRTSFERLLEVLSINTRRRPLCPSHCWSIRSIHLCGLRHRRPSSESEEARGFLLMLPLVLEALILTR